MLGADRSNYLLVKEAKIIAMTCTHAALKRRDLVELGFKVRYIYAWLDCAQQLFTFEGTKVTLMLSLSFSASMRYKAGILL